MATAPQPLHVDTRHEERQVVLGCDSCGVRDTVSTRDPVSRFTARVGRFFDAHCACRAR